MQNCNAINANEVMLVGNSVADASYDITASYPDLDPDTTDYAVDTDFYIKSCTGSLMYGSFVVVDDVFTKVD